jgi:hypothetical protein
MRETQFAVLVVANIRPLAGRNVDHKQLKTIGLLKTDGRGRNGHFPMLNTRIDLVHCETAEPISRDFDDRPHVGWDKGAPVNIQ